MFLGDIRHRRLHQHSRRDLQPRHIFQPDLPHIQHPRQRQPTLHPPPGLQRPSPLKNHRQADRRLQHHLPGTNIRLPPNPMVQPLNPLLHPEPARRQHQQHHNLQPAKPVPIPEIPLLARQHPVANLLHQLPPQQHLHLRTDPLPIFPAPGLQGSPGTRGSTYY